MKLFTAGFLTETSDLTPIATGLDDWRIEWPGSGDRNPTITYQALQVFRDQAQSKGWEVAQSLCATALPPGGRIIKDVYEQIRDDILRDLEAAMPVDAVLLQLHGAAMAFGYDDCEGDLLAHIRSIIGPDTPIGVELDPHCHMTEKMLFNATIILLYKTLLHTDIKEIALELFQLMVATVEGRVRPTMAVYDCKMMNFSGFDETSEPMKSLMEKVSDMENQSGVLSISPVHCFPFANIPDMGCKFLVITDNNQPLAEEIAANLGAEFTQVGHQLFQQTVAFTPQLDQAEALNQKGVKPVRLLEIGDMAGCGFPTDGTELVSEMLGRGMSNMAVGLVWDPMAVSICNDAGAGSELKLRVGGKASVLSGKPLDLNVTVDRLYHNVTTSTWLGDMLLGDVAVVSSSNTEIILVSRRVLGYDLEVFRELGLDPNSKDYLVLKYFCGPEETIHAYGPSLAIENWGFDNIARPLWPWDKQLNQ